MTDAGLGDVDGEPLDAIAMTPPTPSAFAALVGHADNFAMDTEGDADIDGETINVLAPAAEPSSIPLPLAAEPIHPTALAALEPREQPADPPPSPIAANHEEAHAAPSQCSAEGVRRRPLVIKLRTTVIRTPFMRMCGRGLMPVSLYGEV
jgi:hypothetical protein